MTRVQRLLAASIVVAVASVAFAAVRLATSGGEASSAPQAPSRAPAPASVETSAEGEPAAPIATRAVRSAKVNLKQGIPAPRPARIRARAGDEIRLTVTSSGAEDEVVVNGYGTRARVNPEQPARLRFVATLNGSFDVVLQTSGVKVADLDVAR